ncbi:MAG: alpha-glucosidase [Candidatus Gastranaerophilaceae bacterium]|jgi:oligo-1,6-glucosidase
MNISQLQQTFCPNNSEKKVDVNHSFNLSLLTTPVKDKFIRQVVSFGSSDVSINKASAAPKVDFSDVPPSQRKWWKEAVVYQIYPMSFKDTDGNGTGDIKGITQKLDYLQKLGINTLWLNPIYSSPEADNGYDISDYKGINPKYGTMQDMEKLIKEAHDRKMHIIMDVVFNHTSDEHPWFKAASDPNHPEHKKYKDYYTWADPKEGTKTLAKPQGEVPNGWESVFKGPAWAYNDRMGKYYFHLFHKKQPDLNWKNPEVRKSVDDITNFWVKKGIDGFRMDVIDHVGMNKPYFDPKKEKFIDTSRLNGYLKNLHKNALSHPLNPEKELMTVGECPCTNLDRIPFVVGDDKLSMIFNFDHIAIGDENGTKWTTKKPSLADLRSVITKWQKGTEEKGLWNSNFFMNHDQPRAVSQYGNDSTEEFRKDSSKMLATLNLTLKGTPYVYMGEEIGMTNVRFDDIREYKDVETKNIFIETIRNAKRKAEKEAKEQGLPASEVKKRSHNAALEAKNKVMDAIKAKGRDNSRTPMQWDASEKAGFTTGTPWIEINKNHSLNSKYSPINVVNSEKDSDSILYYYQKMIQVRKENPVLVYGKFNIFTPDDKQVFAYTRTLGNKKALVVLNYSDKSANFSTKENNLNLKDSKLLISNNTIANENDKESINLKPYEARVYLCKIT